MNTLYERAGWALCQDGGRLEVLSPAGRPWEIGWMYGRAAGLITTDENYAVAAGCGVVVADLTCFGEEVTPGRTLSQTPAVHLLCDLERAWFFEAVYEAPPAPGGLPCLRLVGDLREGPGGLYELRLDSLQLAPLWLGQAPE